LQGTLDEIRNASTFRCSAAAYLIPPLSIC
jgi:hypothetical protein